MAIVTVFPVSSTCRTISLSTADCSIDVPRSGHEPDKLRIVDSTTDVLEGQNLAAARPSE